MELKLGEQVTLWGPSPWTEEFCGSLNHNVVMSHMLLDSMYRKEVLHAHTMTYKGILAALDVSSPDWEGNIWNELGLWASRRICTLL